MPHMTSSNDCIQDIVADDVFLRLGCCYDYYFFDFCDCRCCCGCIHPLAVDCTSAAEKLDTVEEVVDTKVGMEVSVLETC